MRKGKLFPVASPYSVISHRPDYRIQATGEFRCPNKEEWFISGAIPEGYQAPNDLSTPYYIGKLVKVKTTVVETVIEENVKKWEREHFCLPCKYHFTKEVEFSEFTQNLSGEKTTFCPKCNKRVTMSSPAKEV